MSVLHQMVPVFFMLQFVLIFAGLIVAMLRVNPQA